MDAWYSSTNINHWRLTALVDGVLKDIGTECKSSIETLETIGKRTSLKASLSAREVEQEKITKILDAARFAPSARNQQQWRFIVIRSRENVENVVTKAFLGFNQVSNISYPFSRFYQEIKHYGGLVLDL